MDKMKAEQLLALALMHAYKDTTTDLEALPSPCTASPRPSRSIRFGDVSEANGRGKLRQIQTAHAFVLLFKMADFTGLYKMLQTAANKGT